VRNHTNCVDLRNLIKSDWDQELGERDTACGSTDLICEEGMWMCVDYGALDKALVKNRYPLPLISEMLDRTSRIAITSSESRKTTSTTPRVAPSTGSSRTESCCSGWLTHQLPSYQGTTPNREDKSSAEQRRLKRGMTLLEVPEWSTRMHLTTEKSSGDKCTQRARINVPREVSTYSPSIRKMISPPREQPLRSIETSSNTESYLEHLLSKSTRSPYP